MNFLKGTILFFILISSQMSDAQIFDKHQWKNRIVILITEDVNSTIYKDQLAEFEGQESGLNDRKLIIYTITPNGYLKGMDNQMVDDKSELYNRLKKENEGFRILLIGLDGGIKMDQHNIISRKVLFETIDSMPMRQSELRRKNKPE